MVAADKQEKKLGAYCEHIYTGMVEHGVPDMGIQFVDLRPKTKMVDGNQANAFCRFDVHMKEKTTAFQPKALTDTELAAPFVKKGAFGALFCGNMSKLPKRDAQTLWEMEIVKTHPAHLRIVKVKQWLMGTLDMTKGLYYRAK